MLKVFVLRGVLISALAAGTGVVANGAEEAKDPVSEKGHSRIEIVLVRGAGGEKEFGDLFDEWTQKWVEKLSALGVPVEVIGGPEIDGEEGDAAPVDGGPVKEPSPDNISTSADEPKPARFEERYGLTEAKTDRQQLRKALEAAQKETSKELWLIMFGHGVFDGRTARFNLRGPDISAEELAEWITPLERPLVVVNTGSASAPFINALSGKGRIIATSTRSGHEQNFARFGGYFTEAMFAGESADLDQDGQVSLLEAFLLAAKRVEEFYEAEGRLLTEHALIDDNGDGQGTPAEWYRGVRVNRSAESGIPDGARAQQHALRFSALERALSEAERARRNELELAIEQLRGVKRDLPEGEYYELLEGLLVEVARLYESAAKRSSSADLGEADDEAGVTGGQSEVEGTGGFGGED